MNPNTNLKKSLNQNIQNKIAQTDPIDTSNIIINMQENNPTVEIGQH